MWPESIRSGLNSGDQSQKAWRIIMERKEKRRETYLKAEDGVEYGQKETGCVDHKHDGIGVVQDLVE